MLIENDLNAVEGRLQRHRLEVGVDHDGAPVWVAPYGVNLLIAGPSGSGKSTAAASFLERLAEHHYHFCLVDPEGDYGNFPGTVTLGTAQHGPSVEEVLQLLATSHKNMVLNLLGLTVMDRPSFFLGLLPRLQELRVRTGRPHWLIVDEAHHLLPASWEPGTLVLPRDLSRTLYITVHPEQVVPAVLESIDLVVAVGPSPADTLGRFSAAVKEPSPAAPPPQEGEVIFWSRRQRQVRRVRMLPSTAERRRHTRKYAEGELPPDHSFYFRGPAGKLNLRAQNLVLFLQLAEGVDDETWLHHLQQGDYSRWFRERIKDETLAAEAEDVERRSPPSAAASRANIKALVQRYYTLPAGPPLPLPGTDAPPRHGAQRES
jgi:hypothetical protein